VSFSYVGKFRTTYLAYYHCSYGFLKKKELIDKIAIIGSGAAGFTKHQFIKLKILNFLKSKQKKIAEFYYQPEIPNKNLTLEKYFTRECERNACRSKTYLLLRGDSYKIQNTLSRESSFPITKKVLRRAFVLYLKIALFIVI